MALIKKDKMTKEEKTEQKEQELMARYGLESVSDPIDIESLKKITTHMIGTGMLDLGMKLMMKAKPEDQLQAQYQRVLVEQNFIIIRQLDRIARLLQENKD